MYAYTMMLGPNAGRSTTDVEQYIRWLSGLTVVTPEHAQRIRDVVRECEETDRIDDQPIKVAAKVRHPSEFKE